MNGEPDPKDRAGGDDALDAEELAAEVVEGDLDRLLGERDEMRALAQQIQADFENYRKQAMRRETAIVERASESLVEALLPVLDSFDAAVTQLPPDTDEGVRKGVELVFAQRLYASASAAQNAQESGQGAGAGSTPPPSDDEVAEAEIVDEGDAKEA